MNNNSKEHGPSVFLIVLGFIFWWPVGLGMLLYKLGLFDGLIRSFKGSSTVGAETTRFQKYKLMSRGSSALSIDHMASAVGVSYESCLREVQKMVAAGEFGKDAYINYVDRTLVLGSAAPGAGADTRVYRSSDNSTGYSSTYSATYSGQSKTPTRYSSGRQGSAAPSDQTQAHEANAQPARKPNILYRLFGAAPGVLLGISITLFIFGAFFGLAVLATLPAINWAITVFSSFFLIGGGTTLISRISMKRRAKRAANYLTVIGGRDFVEVRELSRTCGVNEKTVRRDLEIMIEKGLFGSEAYVDQGHGLLILKSGAAPEKAAEPEVPVDDEDRYKKILREIRQVNDEIPDEVISAKIDEMEDYTARIFKAVQEKPEKLPQIKSFMSYYLPTALKLLHSYADFDQAGAGGENVAGAKADIERILDMLVDGFKKQLDKLYETEAMDISSDIDVLENMLRRDGLKDDESGFGQVAQGGGM
ncbi:MAG: 5-bromo-4-chloroindolyl phosphate hydrolysis family protein [Oscillospiraceae bacterium]|nr:5-bromo-4-chloroindolyl phosphate hydrolysis family protein [Oscillospiraceae bacterium]MBQ3952308.1 5-bromo-4-chloroindolyl phosphate hydrolysis family protein [Oscillospiraceae bacterium]MBQ5567948.1 5-bromo-4-chloroindolyl phosphate hydrolysis family protein [Oscillospiraceae bacterium]